MTLCVEDSQDEKGMTLSDKLKKVKNSKALDFHWSKHRKNGERERENKANTRWGYPVVPKTLRNIIKENFPRCKASNMIHQIKSSKVRSCREVCFSKSPNGFNDWKPGARGRRREPMHRNRESALRKSWCQLSASRSWALNSCITAISMWLFLLTIQQEDLRKTNCACRGYFKVLVACSYRILFSSYRDVVFGSGAMKSLIKIRAPGCRAGMRFRRIRIQNFSGQSWNIERK